MTALAAQMAAEPAAARPSRWAEPPSGRRFYIGMAVACLLVSAVPFAPSMVDRSHRLGSATALVVVHGGLFFAWLLAFLAQTILIGRGDYHAHLRLGIAAAILAAAMVLVGYETAIAMTRRGFDFSGDLDLVHDPLGPRGQLIFPLLDIAEFGLLIAAGLILRHRSDYHKRLMLFATVALLPAPFAHFIGHSPALRPHGALVVLPIVVSLAASAARDLATFRRVHPVSFWVALVMFVLDNLSATIVGHSTAWLRIVDRLVG
ncbi:hypothetical protein [Sphingomonas bacterium]|uniref:hypothetical protein n=1 Tax=Sphingomonas bacterium TaxID=1895847 RepID=UPI0015765D2D|nr:hypothetical protein [Sphingomonas bacterium]